MKQRIYICGNAFAHNDTAALLIQQHLSKHFSTVTFIHFDPTEQLFKTERNPCIIDTVLGISTVTVFTSLASFQAPPIVSVHDYDLYWELQLLVKLKKIQSFTIIALPPQVTDKTIQDTKHIIATELLKNEKHNSCKDHTL